MAIYQGTKKLAYACNVDNSAYSVPIGTILSYASATPPVGFLVCDGSEVSKTTYADLYTIIGDTYGTSTDASKFKLPDLRDKFVQGANGNLGTSKKAGLPNITGSSGDTYIYTNDSDKSAIMGAFDSALITTASIRGNSDSKFISSLNFDASKSNAIYGNSNTVQPPSVCLVFIVKALKVSDKYADTPKDIYSTDEVVTDKVWIDGKPIYRKVVTQTITTAGDLNVIDGFDTSLTNTIISIYGSVKQPSGNITPISYYNTAEDGAFIYMSKSHNRFILNANTCGIGDVVLIVEYTKTND